MYFNDNEHFVCEWLKNLWPGATVECADFRQTQPQYHDRMHWFAGTGGWELALEMAGWPEDFPVWTASLPCQPFSTAGKRLGEQDDRNLWPDFRNLIDQRRPPVIFGEQVASKDGRLWLSRVRADLEALGYAVGAADLCAAGIGAPHIRQRLYWVAYAHSEGLAQRVCHGRVQREAVDSSPWETSSCAVTHGLPNSLGQRDANPGCGEASCPTCRGQGQNGQREWFRANPWERYDIVVCLDGHSRRIPESGVLPLAYGVPARVGRIRAYGNAIVPPLAAEFISAFLETTHVF